VAEKSFFIIGGTNVALLQVAQKLGPYYKVAQMLHWYKSHGGTNVGGTNVGGENVGGKNVGGKNVAASENYSKILQFNIHLDS